MSKGPEYEFQIKVVELARLLGWRHAHFRPLMTTRGYRTPQSGDPGFPDLVLVRPPRVIFVELKATTAVRPEQREWLEQLAASGVESYVWRPADFDPGIIECLRRRQKEEGRPRQESDPKVGRRVP